jgi:hypothetical protein
MIRLCQLWVLMNSFVSLLKVLNRSSILSGDIEKVRNVNWLIDKLNRIDKMNEEERKEVLDLLREEAGKTAEEHRRGEHFMDEIEKYANTLNKEEKKLFYGDLNERWNRVLKEESKRLSKLWK